jgi:hypothetical protein
MSTPGLSNGTALDQLSPYCLNVSKAARAVSRILFWRGTFRATANGEDDIFDAEFEIYVMLLLR